MALVWARKIRELKTLKIYPTEAFTSSPAWGGLFTKGLDHINALIKDAGLKYEKTDTPPARDGFGGAEVQLSVSSGKHSFTAFGSDFDGKMPPGSVSNGRCHHLRYNDYLGKAFLFMPSDPLISVPSGPRMPGSGVLLYILLHEMLHGLGLQDHDDGHDGGGRGDVFRSFPGFEAGATAEPQGKSPGDRIKLDGKKYLPPFKPLTDATLKLLADNWA